MTSHPPIHLEAASTLAVIASSHAPLLLLDGDLTVIAASASFCDAFGIDPATVSGWRLADLGTGEWRVPQLSVLLTATASGLAEVQAYEIDLARRGKETRRLVVNAHKLDYGDVEHVRLLVAIVDITDARAAERLKDDLLREKAVLLQEVQHRVANSLQIIASVLMQSARKVQSEETRTHLRDAHHRVLSIAAVQQQLASSNLNEVALRPYLTQLCESLGASMIRDSSLQSIAVTVDDSVTNADVSVSLGLIVTELVINALKHAFPGGRAGKITVDYHSQGRRWTLTVSDDGIGMAAGADAPKAGLGTGIVEALTRQLHGEISVHSAKPGTAVSIVHTPEIDAVKDSEQAAA